MIRLTSIEFLIDEKKKNNFFQPASRSEQPAGIRLNYDIVTDSETKFLVC